jgi:hypothetical protein
MNRNLKSCLVLVSTLLICSSSFTVSAGNKDRAGQAGGNSLLINPWARSTGWGGANTANAVGLEAMYMNVAGTAFTKKTEVMFAHTNWFGNAGIGINAFGFTQRVGETGVLGFGLMSMNFGDIMVTTYDKPEGGTGTYRPSMSNLGLSYAKEFSNSIYGGLAVRVVSERMADVGAFGICFDAGVRYVTGENDRIKFGIALRNVGPPMRYSGDGLSLRGTIFNSGTTMTMSVRSEPFELPSLLNIGGSYDFRLDETNRITLAGNFTSNSFTKDQIILGLEYGFRNYLMLRAGYMHEQGVRSFAERTTWFTGPTGGVTLELPLNDKGSSFGIDYSYRATNPYGGIHTFGARINL